MNVIQRIRRYLTVDDDRSEVLDGAASTFLLKVGGTGIGYVFNLVLARAFGASVLGVYGLMVTVVSVSQLTAKFGTETSSVRFVASSSSDSDSEGVRKTHRRLLAVVLPLSIAVGGLLYILAPSLARLFDTMEMTQAVQWGSAAVPLGAIAGVNQGCLRGLKEIRASFFFRSALPPTLNLASVAALLVVGWTGVMVPVYGYVFSYLGVAVSSSIWWYQAAYRLDDQSRTSEENTNVAPNLRQIISVSGPLLITAAMHFVMGWADEFVLGIYRETGDVGIYRIAYKMAMVTGFSLQAVNSITAPKIAEFYAQDAHEKLRRLVATSSQLIFWTSAPILAGFIILPEFILGLFGGEFQRAAPALILLCVGQFAAASCGPVGYMLTMTQYERRFQWVLVGGAALNLTLNFLLVPEWGIVGAAVATASSLAAWNVAASALAYRAFGYWIGYTPFSQNQIAKR
jgi:O-antigen/teichoic acid export membrane protein